MGARDWRNWYISLHHLHYFAADFISASLRYARLPLYAASISRDIFDSFEIMTLELFFFFSHNSSIFVFDGYGPAFHYRGNIFILSSLRRYDIIIDYRAAKCRSSAQPRCSCRPAYFTPSFFTDFLNWRLFRFEFYFKILQVYINTILL